MFGIEAQRIHQHRRDVGRVRAHHIHPGDVPEVHAPLGPHPEAAQGPQKELRIGLAHPLVVRVDHQLDVRRETHPQKELGEPALAVRDHGDPQPRGARPSERLDESVGHPAPQVERVVRPPERGDHRLAPLFVEACRLEQRPQVEAPALFVRHPARHQRFVAALGLALDGPKHPPVHAMVVREVTGDDVRHREVIEEDEGVPRVEEERLEISGVRQSDHGRGLSRRTRPRRLPPSGYRGGTKEKANQRKASRR
jgi:hypothetical protein